MIYINDDLLNYVIMIVTKEGKIIPLISDIHDQKHINSYKRVIKKLKEENMNELAEQLSAFIKRRKESQLTGFEISKFVAALGYPIFFHTDVNNSFKRIKEGSFIFPEEMYSLEQCTTTMLLLDLLGDYKIYYGIGKMKSLNKAVYSRLKNEVVAINYVNEKYNKLFVEEVRDNDDYFNDKSIIVIDEAGRLITISKNKNISCHYQGFKIIDDEFLPGILENLDKKGKNLNEISGFDLSAHVAALGYPVIWATDITLNYRYYTITLPKISNLEQCMILQSLIQKLKKYEQNISVNISSFKNYRNFSLKRNTIFQCGTFDELLKCINEYIQSSISLENIIDKNSIQEVTTNDVKKLKR